MGIFKRKSKKLDNLYNAVNKDSRINSLLNCCYEYGKLTPKKGKEKTCAKLKRISKKNRKTLNKIINNKKE